MAAASGCLLPLSLSLPGLAIQCTIGSGKESGEGFDDLSLALSSVQIYDHVNPPLISSQFTLSRRDAQVDVAAERGKKLT